MYPRRAHRLKKKYKPIKRDLKTFQVFLLISSKPSNLTYNFPSKYGIIGRL